MREAEARYKSSRDIEMLRNPPGQYIVPNDAKMQAIDLIERVGKKYSRSWINKLTANIGRIVTISNHATIGAPESVGLAWFAVKLTLSAIQSNYDLYLFSDTALLGITEIIIIILRYDCLYDEQLKANE
jgi:hypothetical protein